MSERSGFVLTSRSGSPRRRSWWRLALGAALAVWIARPLVDPSLILSAWMHGPVLVVHEAGHVLVPFGRFASIFAGTGLQVALPLAFVARFALARQPFGMALMLFWTAFALADGALYVADARDLRLPLLTVDPSTHDWANLLRDLRLLAQDDLLAGLLRAQAWIAWAAGCAAVVFAAQRPNDAVDVGDTT